VFGIGKIDLRAIARSVSEPVNITQTDQGLTLKTPGVGKLLLPPVQITMAVRWEGFDVIGSGSFDLSIRRPSSNPTAPPSFYNYSVGSGEWEPSVVEVFYAEADFRVHFQKWRGAFQLGLKMTKVGQVPAIVTAIHYGYHTIGDFLDYLVKFQLSQFLSTPASFLRTIRINGSRFPIPKGFDPVKIINPRAYEVGGDSQDKSLAISGNEFTLTAPVTNVVHHVYFDYQVPIDSNNEHTPQIETVPSVFFRNQTSANLRFLNSKTYISIDRTTTRCLQIPYLSDLILDVLVFGDTNADANAAANAIATKIAQTGGFWNPGFNYDTIVQLINPVMPTPSGGSVSSNPASGLLFSNTLKLKLANLPHGVFFTDAERIESINPEYSF
jgi:hypothetical protein